MDIWAWVSDQYDELEKNGQERLANLLYQIPDDLHENRVERLESSVIEAIQGARALKNPWMEVFFRHWGLRNRLSNYLEGEKALDEAVSLMDFSHKEESKECPQSICVTQDLASCYGNVDGPGWVAERIAVVDQTLQKITPSKNCWDCLSREKADALRDDNRIEEALNYLIEQEKAIQAHGSSASLMLKHSQADCLQRLGRYEEALALLDEADEKLADEVSRGSMLTRKILEALIYTQQEDYERAKELLPNFRDLQPAEYPKWAATTFLLITKKYKELNTWHFAAPFQQMSTHFENVGSHRLAADILIYQAKLAMDRQSSAVALNAIKRLEKVITKLRKPDEIILQLAELKTQFENTVFVEDDTHYDLEEIIGKIEKDENADPEKYINILNKMHNTHREQHKIAQLLALSLWAIDMTNEAIEILEKQFTDFPLDNYVSLYTLTDFYNQTNQDEKLASLAKICEKDYEIHSLYIKCLLNIKNSEWENLIMNAQKAYELDDSKTLFLNHQVIGLVHLKQFKKALPIMEQFIEKIPEEHKVNALWDLLTYSACAEDWLLHRQTAKKLNLELDEPESNESLVVEELFGAIYIRFIENGEEKYHLALRTGPTTARIKSIAYPGDIQHANDWVVFNAMMLEAPPEDEQERENFTPSFDAVHILEPGNTKVYEIYGPHPTDEQLFKLKEKLADIDGLFWKVSGDFYQVQHPQKDELIDGIYFFIAVPKDVSDLELLTLLKNNTDDFIYPLCWLPLAVQANIDIELQQKIKESYQIKE